MSARLGPGEARGDVDLVDRADLFDRAAQVGLPRRALRRVGEQREPFVDRPLVIAGDILLHRHEIARARILGIERDRLVKGFGRGGGHRIARTRHDARLAKRRP